MSEVKRYTGDLMYGEPIESRDGVFVYADDFDRVTAERDAAMAELVKANEKIDKAWNRKSATDHNGFIPGAMDAWKRPVPQHLPYDFSGNPGASATQYCNGWNDCGGYWSAHASELQQRLTAADELNDLMRGLMQEFCDRVDRGEVRSKTTYAKFKAALSQTEEAPCKTCNGTRIVSDGAMYCSSGGIPFECGPIECVKDCPDCTKP